MIRRGNQYCVDLRIVEDAPHIVYRALRADVELGRRLGETF